MSERTSAPENTAPAPLEERDFYLENGFMVFTREYHLRRGFCCKSGCRHCPWDYTKGKSRDEAEEAP